MAHECAFYQAPKPIRDALCPECARGSKPKRPVQNKHLLALTKVNKPRDK